MRQKTVAAGAAPPAGISKLPMRQKTSEPMVPGDPALSKLPMRQKTLIALDQLLNALF